MGNGRCANEWRHPQRPEEGTEAPGDGFTGTCKPPYVNLGVLTCLSISSAPDKTSWAAFLTICTNSYNNHLLSTYSLISEICKNAKFATLDRSDAPNLYGFIISKKKSLYIH